MSELKATSSGEIRTRNALLGYWWYEKYEADKVIADLEESHKMEVEQLLIVNREQANAANRLRDSMEQAIRHSKYKRCLAMARWCERNRIDAANYRKPREKWEFYDKWYNRWIKIAEKFKPNKEVK